MKCPECGSEFVYKYLEGVDISGEFHDDFVWFCQNCGVEFENRE